jgi:multiple antibiotic resistance protein
MVNLNLPFFPVVRLMISLPSICTLTVAPAKGFPAFVAVPKKRKSPCAHEGAVMTNMQNDNSIRKSIATVNISRNWLVYLWRLPLSKIATMEFDLKAIGTVTMVLFAVIDVVGSIPVIIGLKQKVGDLNAEKASLVSLAIMIGFLFVGEPILSLIGITVSDFAIAGSFVLFFLSLEMILGIRLYKDEVPATASVMPLAFPLLAGTGTLTTILSLRAEFDLLSIIIGVVVNVVIIYVVLRNIGRLEKLLGVGGVAVLRKVFGIILLAIAVKLFRTHAGI